VTATQRKPLCRTKSEDGTLSSREVEMKNREAPEKEEMERV